MNEITSVKRNLPSSKLQQRILNETKNIASSDYQKIIYLVENAWDLRDKDAQQALALSQSAVTKIPSLPIEKPTTKGLQAEVFKTLGYLYKRLGSYDLGLLYAFKSLELCRELELIEGCIVNLQTLGWCYTHLGNFSEGLKPFLEALELCQQKESSYLKAHTLLGLSTLYYYLESFEQALKFEEETLELYKVLDDPQGKFVLLNSLSKTHFKLGHLDTALNYAQKSLELSQNLQELELGRVLNTLGLIYREKGDLREALHYFQGALARLKIKESRQFAAETFLNIGSTYLQQNELERALHYCKKALESAERVNAKNDMLGSHLQLAKTYKRMGDFQKSLFHYESYHDAEKAIFNEKADNKLKSLQIFHETERVRQQTEIYRLQNVELKDAKFKLEQRMQELKLLHQKVKELSIRDGLTDLYNRRYLDEQLSILFSRARRYNQPISVAIIDVDNFKKLNDTFSHQVGDEALKCVANILVNSLRESDLAARYGGEEFVLTLPETNLEQALVVCERTRRQIANYDWGSLNSNLEVTVSVGVADAIEVKDHEEQLQIADKRLYIAKRSGKNKVVAES